MEKDKEKQSSGELSNLNIDQLCRLLKTKMTHRMIYVSNIEST